MLVTIYLVYVSQYLQVHDMIISQRKLMLPQHFTNKNVLMHTTTSSSRPSSQQKNDDGMNKKWGGERKGVKNRQSERGQFPIKHIVYVSVFAACLNYKYIFQGTF